LLKDMNPHVWRAHTGCVMQDGFIFSDTIARNIAVGAESIDRERLLHAVTVANIREFIDSLPLGYNTRIGMEGNGVSQGQRQRILIARAVYKDPEFIFLDEATNALDTNNEKEIMEHLHRFYRGRTVVVVAHRLSTVRDADNIVVLDDHSEEIPSQVLFRGGTEPQALIFQTDADPMESKRFKLVTGIFCNQKMPIMNGIEGTAKYTDFLFVQSHIPYSISDGLRQNNLWIFLIRFI